MKPEDRAKAIAEHFSTLPPAVLQELRSIVASAIRRAVMQELRGIESVAQHLFMKPCKTERDQVRMVVYQQWLVDVSLRRAKYAVDDVGRDPGSVIPGRPKDPPIKWA